MKTPIDDMLNTFIKASEKLPQTTIEQAKSYEA